MGATGATGPAGADGNSSGVVYYFNYNTLAGASGPTGGTFHQMSTTISEGAQAIVTVTGTPGSPTKFVGGFLTPAGSPNVALIPAGLWQFAFYATQSENSNTTAGIYAEIWTATVSGSTCTLGTKIGTNASFPEIINNTGPPDLHVANLSVPNTVVTTSTRIVVLFYASNVQNSKTMSMYFEDTTVSQVITSLPASVALAAMRLAGPAGAVGSAGDTGSTGPTGAAGDHYLTSTTLDLPNSVSEGDTLYDIQVDTGLAYITGNSVIFTVTGATASFEAFVTSYDSVTGIMNINSITNIVENDFYGTNPYQVNLSGQRGSMLFTGDGAPTINARIGDFYINSNMDIYFYR
jgi:hypothetical protein